MKRRARNVLDTFHQLDEGVVVVLAHRCEAHTTVAHHHSGHTVPRRRLELIVPCRLAVVVRVDINPSRRDEQPVSSNRAVSRSVDAADRDDPVAAHREVSCDRWRTRSVDDGSTLNYEI